MKCKIAYSLFSVFIFLTLCAQKNTDSLRRLMTSAASYDKQIQAALQLIQFYQLKHFDSALETGRYALELTRKNADVQSEALVKHQMGVAHYFSGYYDSAAKNYQESIYTLEKEKADPRKLALVYNDLAKLYRKTRDLDKALSNYGKAEAIFKSVNDTSGIAMILNESGVVYEYKKDYKEAVNRYAASMHLAEKKGDSLSVSYSLSHMAGIFVIEKQYGLAERYLLRSLRIRELLRDSFAMALAYSDLGVTLNAKGDYKRAIEYLEQSNQIAIRLKYPELQSNNYYELSQAATQLGDFRKAYDYYALRTHIRDSLFAIEKTKEIERLNAQYENVRKEQQILAQKQKLKLQNFIIAGILSVMLLGVLLIYSNYKRLTLQKEKAFQQQLLSQQEMNAKAVLEAEENERQRIARDLHDGIGQMMSAAKMNLSAMENEIPFTDEAQKLNFEKVLNMLDDSCKELRNVSHNMTPAVLQKNNLAEALRDFIEKLNLKNIEIRLSAEGMDTKMDSAYETILYRVVQECVHNAIKHSGATRIDISLIKDDDGISGTIEDNGKGFDVKQMHSDSSGVGLKNIMTRIEFLKGELEIDSAPGRGTVISFHIPPKSELQV
ncbi:MAG: sensor histidine kinase [Chitinophagaceae bacterium]|nr:sensor histidine kinase [Chitinophagaceae bacterium]